MLNVHFMPLYSNTVVFFSIVPSDRVQIQFNRHPEKVRKSYVATAQVCDTCMNDNSGCFG